MKRVVLAVAVLSIAAACGSTEQPSDDVADAGFTDPPLCPPWSKLGERCQSGQRCRYEGGYYGVDPRPKSSCWVSSATATCRDGSWVIEDRDSGCSPYPYRPDTGSYVEEFEDTGSPLDTAADGEDATSFDAVTDGG